MGIHLIAQTLISIRLLLPKELGWAALGRQSVSGANGLGPAEFPPELLNTIVLEVSKACSKFRIGEVMSIIPPKSEFQAVYEHPLQRHLDNPATIFWLKFKFLTFPNSFHE